MRAYGFQAALREFRRDPWVMGASVAIVALAISSATALFSVVDGLFLRPLPFVRAEELAAVRTPSVIGRHLRIDDLRVERERMEASASVAASAWAHAARLVDAMTASSEGTNHYAVSPGFFPLLGTAPLIGRWLNEGDDAAEPSGAVIGHDLWQARFGGDPDVLGRIVPLQGRELRIRGVMPAGFEFPWGANLWTLQRERPDSPPGYVRLVPGISVAQFASQFPRLDIFSLEDVVRPSQARPIGFLFGATLLVVVVAWVQVVSLQFGRATARVGNVGIRMALGATRAQLSREFLAEGLLLAGAGVVLAWMAVPALTAAVVRWLPPALLRGQHIAADERAFAFACALAAVGVIAAVIVPQEWLSAATPMRVLRGDTGVLPRRSGRARTTLLFAQLGTTAWLLYLSGLAFHSLLRLSALDIGFEPSSVLTLTLGLDRLAPISPGQGQLRLQTLSQALREIPSVSTVGYGLLYPLSPGGLVGTAQLPRVPGFQRMSVRWNLVSHDYLKTLGVTVVSGRAFDQADQEAAIVNETMASHLAVHGDVIGQFIQVTAQRARIVGVVRDFVDERPGVSSEPQVIFLDRAGLGGVVLVRVAGDPRRALPVVRQIAQQIWGEKRVEIALMRDHWRAAMADYRGRAMLLTWLAAVGVVLCLIGLASTLTTAVRQRRRELAVRLVLGAWPGTIQRLVVRWALMLVVGASVTGILLGAATGRWARSLFFEVGPVDVATSVVLLVVLSATALLAAWLPAQRAAQIDPAITLRD